MTTPTNLRRLSLLAFILLGFVAHNAKAACLLGDILYSRAPRDEAMVAWRSPIASDPRHFSALRDLGLALLEAGRNDEALPLLTRAIEQRPDLPSNTILVARLQNARSNPKFTRPTLKATSCSPKICTGSVFWQVKVYEDDHYLFVYNGFGNQNAPRIPGFYLRSKKRQKWLEIKGLTTENARLGFSPPFEEVPLMVGWDWRGLGRNSYAELPLKTGGSISFPNRIIDEPGKQAYRLVLNPNLQEKYQTIFYLLKKDIEAVFTKTK